MSKCDLEIVLDRPDRTYRPGDTVSGFVGVTVNKGCHCRALTITRQWRTHGSGNRKRGSTEEVVAFEGEWSAGEQHVHPFQFEVPPGPLTYHGHHLNVDWYIEARADIPWAFDPKASEEFVLAPDPEGPPLNHGPAHLTGPDTAARALGWVVSAVVGAGVMVFASMFLCIGVGAAFGGEPIFAVAFITLPLVFVLVGLFLVSRALRQPLAKRALGEVDLVVHPESVRGGESVTLRLSFTPRRATGIEGVTARLVAQERCVSGSGTNKRTYRHTVYEQVHALEAPSQVLAGHTVSIEDTLPIPPDPAPSFAAPQNALTWRVEVTVDRPGWMDWTQAWLLTVRP